MKLDKKRRENNSIANIDYLLKKKRQISNMLRELEYILEPFYRIDYRKLENLRVHLRQLEREIDNLQMPMTMKRGKHRETKADLIGLLPLILMSKEMFRSNKDLAEYVKNVLDIEISKSSMKSRSHIIGEALVKVSGMPSKDLDLMVDKLQNTLRNKAKHKKSDFFKEWDLIIGRMRSGQS